MLFCSIIIYYCLRPIEHPELNRNLMQSKKPEKKNTRIFLEIKMGKRGHFYANLFLSLSSLPLFTQRTCVS